MEINLFSFNARKVKDKIIQSMEQNQNYEGCDSFKQTVKNVIDDNLVAEIGAVVASYVLSNYEMESIKEGKIQNINAPSFYLSYSDPFTGKKNYKSKLLYKVNKNGICDVYIKYEKLFKEEDHFDFKIQFSINVIRKMLEDPKAYKEVINTIIQNFEEKIKISSVFVDELTENIEKYKDFEVEKHIFLIIAGQNANRQYCKYLKRKNNENKKK